MVPILSKLHCNLNENLVDREACGLGPNNMILCVLLQMDFRSIGYPHILSFSLLSFSDPPQLLNKITPLCEIQTLNNILPSLVHVS